MNITNGREKKAAGTSYWGGQWRQFHEGNEAEVIHGKICICRVLDLVRMQCRKRNIGFLFFFELG